MDLKLFASAVLALGIAVAGWFAGNGFVEARTAERSVTVKGLAEREVQADLALWPMQYVVDDDDLGRAQSRMVEATAKVQEFLSRHGFAAEEVELAAKDFGLETHSMDGFDGECIKKEFGIPQDKIIPMLIAVGWLRPGITLLPRAFRRNLSEFISFNAYEREEAWKEAE